MHAKFKFFIANESGAITVDWVVLTAACVALGLLTIALVSGAIRDNSREASAIMTTYEIDAEFDTEAEISALQQAANDAVSSDPEVEEE